MYNYCATEVINHGNKIAICQFVIFKIPDLIFIPLSQENHYIVIPYETTSVHTLCDKNNTEQISISTPSLFRTSLIYSETPGSLIYGTNLMKIESISKTVDYSTKRKAIPVDNDTNFTTRQTSDRT